MVGGPPHDQRHVPRHPDHTRRRALCRHQQRPPPRGEPPHVSARPPSRAPQSYLEDYQTANGAGAGDANPAFSDAEKAELYAELASGAETGACPAAPPA